MYGFNHRHHLSIKRMKHAIICSNKKNLIRKAVGKLLHKNLQVKAPDNMKLISRKQIPKNIKKNPKKDKSSSRHSYYSVPVSEEGVPNKIKKSELCNFLTLMEESKEDAEKE